MSNIIVGRTRARSQAIQVLFQAEVQGVDVFDLLEGGDYVLDDGPLDKYAAQLARGVAVNRLAIDHLVGGVSHNWNLSRMPLVDRCVMSIAVYEMFCEEAVPSSVAISEAVELSKVYVTDDSSSFVNGILGRVSRLSEANPGLALPQLARLVEGGQEPDGDDAAPGEEPCPCDDPACEPAPSEDAGAEDAGEGAAGAEPSDGETEHADA